MKNTILLIAVLSLLIIGCQSDTSGQYNYQAPEYIDDGLNVGTLVEANIDPVLIKKAVNNIHSRRYKEVHSLLIFKDDKLVLEEYFKGHQYQWDAPYHHSDWVGWDKEMLHHVMSVTKSITSACIGIAIENGFIKSVHESIFDYLPNHQHLKSGGKDKITIEHLLTMTFGIGRDEWNAPYSSPENPIIALWFPPCEDPITCILNKPLTSEPGTNFAYFGGNMIVLGEIIRHATNMDIDEFSRKYLFEPLAIDTSDWAVRFENGVIEAAGGLKLTPRAMAKIGITFLDQGMWNGKRIVSQQWVEKSAQAYSDNQGIKIPGVYSGKNGYSYSWWTKSYTMQGKKINLFYAGGWGGQNIIVLPELNAVVVFSGGNYTSKVKVFKLLEKYIIPALMAS